MQSNDTGRDNLWNEEVKNLLQKILGSLLQQLWRMHAKKELLIGRPDNEPDKIITILRSTNGSKDNFILIFRGPAQLPKQEKICSLFFNTSEKVIRAEGELFDERNVHDAAAALGHAQYLWELLQSVNRWEKQQSTVSMY